MRHALLALTYSMFGLVWSILGVIGFAYAAAGLSPLETLRIMFGG